MKLSPIPLCRNTKNARRIEKDIHCPVYPSLFYLYTICRSSTVLFFFSFIFPKGSVLCRGFFDNLFELLLFHFLFGFRKTPVVNDGDFFTCSNKIIGNILLKKQCWFWTLC